MTSSRTSSIMAEIIIQCPPECEHSGVCQCVLLGHILPSHIIRDIKFNLCLNLL